MAGTAIACAKTAASVRHHGGLLPHQQDILNWIHHGRIIMWPRQSGKSIVRREMKRELQEQSS